MELKGPKVIKKTETSKSNKYLPGELSSQHRLMPETDINQR
jgi:hypothetical protein